MHFPEYKVLTRYSKGHDYIVCHTIDRQNNIKALSRQPDLCVGDVVKQNLHVGRQKSYYINQ